MNELDQVKLRLLQLETDLLELRDDERRHAIRTALTGPDRDSLFHPFRVKRNGPTTAMTALVSDGVVNAGAPGDAHGLAHKYLEADTAAFNLTADFADGDHVLYMEVTLSDNTDPTSVTLTPKYCTAAEFLTKNTDDVCAQLLFSFTNATADGTKRTTKTRQELFSDFCVPIHSEDDGYGGTVWRVSWSISNVAAGSTEQLKWSLQAVDTTSTVIADGENDIPIAAVENQWAKTVDNTIVWKAASTGTYRITARMNLVIDEDPFLLDYLELSFKTGTHPADAAVARPAKYQLWLYNVGTVETYNIVPIYFDAIVTQYAVGAAENSTSCKIINNQVQLVIDASITYATWRATDVVVTVERLHDPLPDSAF